MKRALLIGGGIIGLYVAVVLAGAGALARIEHAPITRTPAELGVAFETVAFSPPDAPIALRAWWMPARAARAAVILVHGGGSNRSNEYSDGLRLARDLVANGYSVLALDLRGHGESDDPPGGQITFGDDEAFDVVGAVNYLADRGAASRFAALGFSMGGMTVIQAAARDPRIEVVISNDAPPDIREAMIPYARAETGLPAWLLPPFLWAAETVYRVPFDRGRPKDVVGRIAPRPVLVIQTEGDPIVSVDQARQLAAAGASTALWVVGAPAATDPRWASSAPWGMHVRSYALDPAAYGARVVSLLDGVFGAAAPAESE